MRREEILQLKVMSLQTAQGDQLKAQSIYDWLREKTDDDGTPLQAQPPVEEGVGFA